MSVSKDIAIIPMCDIHYDDVAQALCHSHKKLLCLSCVLEKAKSPECSITELRKVSADKDTLIVECLSVRQIATRKKRLVDEHEQKTGALKDKLKENVAELHDKLTECLVKMKDNCLKTIDSNAKNVTAGNELIKQRLDTLETAINDNIDKLSAESIENIVEIKAKLKEVKTEIMENIPDKDSVPEGDFKPNDTLKEVIMKKGASFGTAYLMDLARYEKIDDETDGANDFVSKPNDGPRHSISKPNDGARDSISKPNDGPCDSISKPNDGARDSISKPNDGPRDSISKPNDGPRDSISKPNDGARDSISKPWYASSDEIVYATKQEQLCSTQPNVITKESKSPTQTSEKQSLERGKAEQSTEVRQTSPVEKSGKPRRGIFKWLSSDKRKSDQLEGKAKRSDTDTKDQRMNTLQEKRTSSKPEKKDSEKIYQDSTFYTPSYTSPKYLINKRVTVSDMKQYFSSACKFSKLVYLGDGYIGMLSRIHNSLLLVGTSGQFFGKKTFKEGNYYITAIGNQDVAVIAEAGLQVSKFRVSEKGFTPVGSFIVSGEISNITGIDFDLTSSTYAVSSTDKVIVLDKSGKTLKTVPYTTTKTPASDEIVTTYDFKNECLYILNIKDKTLKMLSLEKSDSIWKRKFDSHSVAPRNMCHYKDKLCITCGDAVTIFSAMSGEPIVKHDTNDLLDDCLGICVIDDVIVVSSNSEKLDKSASLAYVSL